MTRTTNRISEYEARRGIRPHAVDQQAALNTAAWLRRFTTSSNPYLRQLAARQYHRAINKTITGGNES